MALRAAASSLPHIRRWTGLPWRRQARTGRPQGGGYVAQGDGCAGRGGPDGRVRRSCGGAGKGVCLEDRRQAVVPDGASRAAPRDGTEEVVQPFVMPRTFLAEVPAGEFKEGELPAFKYIGKRMERVFLKETPFAAPAQRPGGTRRVGGA